MKLIYYVWAIKLTLMLSLGSFYGHAFIVGPVKVTGVVVKYNKKTVILKSGGQKVRVPRKSIPKKFKLKTGKTVYALLEVEPLQSQMRKEAKQMRKQAKNKTKNKRTKRRTAGAR